MSATAIRIEDMHCAACVHKISAQLQSLPFVESFQINPVRRQVVVTHHASDGDFRLLQCLESLGFKPTLKRQGGIDDVRVNAARIKRLGIAGICMMQVMMASLALYFGEFWGMEEQARRLLSWACLVFTLPIVGYCATPFFANALAAWRKGVNMDVPVALAIAIAFCVSVFNLVTDRPHVYFDSVAMFTFLLLAARQIDHGLKQKIGSDDAFFASAPLQVQRLTATGQEMALLSEVQVGDRLRVGEGALVPVDCCLLEASALIDEASFSGESQWVRKQPGERLFAGTFNRGAALICEAVTRAGDSRAAQIERLADRIHLSKAPLARLADQVAGWFVPAILVAAAATTAFWWSLGSERALSAGLSVLIVSCPCALALAIPAALSAAMARLRRLGMLLTDSAILEVAPQISQLYFDKTGTLTTPELSLLRTEVLGDYSERDCLSLAKALQRYSSHPIARAFTAVTSEPVMPRHQEQRFALSNVQLVPGQGIQALLATDELRIGTAQFCGLTLADSPGSVYLCLAGKALACFSLGAQPRPDSVNAIARLRALGLHITMLSGDQPAACTALAQQLNIGYSGGLQPEAKRDFIASRRSPADKVLFVGDGINDALAFVEADIAVATLETSDLVRASAGATLLTARLGAVADLFETAVAARAVMRQNLGWALIYNLIAIPSAMAGLMPPWLAALGMATSSMIVMLNATRLLRGTKKPQVLG